MIRLIFDIVSVICLEVLCATFFRLTFEILGRCSGMKVKSLVFHYLGREEFFTCFKVILLRVVFEYLLFFLDY